MSETRRIVCLANSRKLSGRCIAGKLRDGTWIRPVSARPTEEVSEHERQYEDGRDPVVLDVIDVPLLEPHPKSYQSENWLLDPTAYWKKVAEFSWDGLTKLADDPETLWSNRSSTYHGTNDRVALDEAQQLTSSLYLLRTNDLTLRVFAPGEAFGNSKRRVQARFTHRGLPYWLWVTDPVAERGFLAQPDGDYQVGSSYCTVSLGEPHQDFCYKLVAAVISENPLRALDGA